MTPKQINERIAKLCGWEQRWNGCWEKDGKYYETHPPRYTESLDLCQVFEKLIQGNGSDPEVYEDALAQIIGVDDDWYTGISFREAAKLVYATPQQRCEAFLRMKGEWEE